MTDQVRDLQDTVVAVTGATAGIGRATARQLVEQGARVALLGRRQERLDELVAELGSDRVAVVAGDVADPDVNARLVGAGRNDGDAWLEDVLTAEDVAAAIVATLAQPRRLRTQQWVLRSMAEES